MAGAFSGQEDLVETESPVTSAARRCSWTAAGALRPVRLPHRRARHQASVPRRADGPARMVDGGDRGSLRRITCRANAALGTSFGVPVGLPTPRFMLSPSRVAPRPSAGTRSAFLPGHVHHQPGGTSPAHLHHHHPMVIPYGTTPATPAGSTSGPTTTRANLRCNPSTDGGSSADAPITPMPPGC